MHLESLLSPRMYRHFADLPLPRQLHWGDQEKQTNQYNNLIKCLDTVGCRSNFFIERTRPIPIGCPLDELEAVFDDNGQYRRHLEDFEWLWVDVFEQDSEEGFQDAPELHRLYDGPHLYPLETVQYLMSDGFLRAGPTTIPWGWVPSHRRPAKHLRDAFQEIKTRAKTFRTRPRVNACSSLSLG